MVKKAGTLPTDKAEKKAQPKTTTMKASKTSVAKKASKVTVTKKAAAKKSQRPATAKKNSSLPVNKKEKKPLKKKAAKNTKPIGKKPPYKKPKADEECFLTTACVSYYALPDDGYELSTLRSFRDKYMLKNTKGNKLVKQYYKIAPLIVSRINKDKEHNLVYQYVYHSIQKACSEIEQKKYKVAQQTYVSLVNHLSKKYRIG